MYLTLLHKLGIDLQSFGDSSGRDAYITGDCGGQHHMKRETIISGLCICLIGDSVRDGS